MMKSNSLKLKTSIKAAGMGNNHSRAMSGLKVKSGLKAGGMGNNHSRRLG